jgi:hypothetical protein
MTTTNPELKPILGAGDEWCESELRDIQHEKAYGLYCAFSILQRVVNGCNPVYPQ